MFLYFCLVDHGDDELQAFYRRDTQGHDVEESCDDQLLIFNNEDFHQALIFFVDFMAVSLNFSPEGLQWIFSTYLEQQASQREQESSVQGMGYSVQGQSSIQEESSEQKSESSLALVPSSVPGQQSLLATSGSSYDGSFLGKFSY